MEDNKCSLFCVYNKGYNQDCSLRTNKELQDIHAMSARGLSTSANDVKCTNFTPYYSDISECDLKCKNKHYDKCEVLLDKNETNKPNDTSCVYFELNSCEINKEVFCSDRDENNVCNSKSGCILNSIKLEDKIITLPEVTEDELKICKKLTDKENDPNLILSKNYDYYRPHPSFYLNNDLVKFNYIVVNDVIITSFINGELKAQLAKSYKFKSIEEMNEYFGDRLVLLYYCDIDITKIITYYSEGISFEDKDTLRPEIYNNKETREKFIKSIGDVIHTTSGDKTIDKIDVKDEINYIVRFAIYGEK